MSHESQHSTLWLVTHHLSLVTGFLVFNLKCHFPTRGRVGGSGSLRIRLARRSLGRGRRSHSCQNVWLIAKIFRSHFLDVLKCDGVHGLIELLIKIETQAVKLVE